MSVAIYSADVEFYGSDPNVRSMDGGYATTHKRTMNVRLQFDETQFAPPQSIVVHRRTTSGLQPVLFGFLQVLENHEEMSGR